MCGIAGIVNLSAALPPPSRELVRSMVRAIRHRGPDEFGLYRDGRAALGHARLSIVDLASGQQPMANEDDTRWLVFNGEVFNFVELRSELEDAGHVFRTHSDTEVIIHAWEQWGIEAFARFNGQWAIALWDTGSEELVLCRDRVGVRPLFVHEGGGRVRFASEVKAIFADPEVPRELDVRGLEETFTFWASRAPTSVFAGVSELPPGVVRRYTKAGARHDHVYWSPEYPRVQGEGARDAESCTLDEAVSGLRDRLHKASELRMLRADVPVGAYLSGGIDSSYVAWLARDAVRGRFHTFSLRFEDPEYDETRYQRLMVERLHSDHAEVVASRSDIARVFPDVVAHSERPLLRTGPAPLFLLSKLVRDAGLKVVLTGEGSDEMLGGYDLFREAKVRRFWSRQPQSKLRPKLFDRLYPWLARSPAAARGLALQFWARGIDHPEDPTFSHGPRWSSASALQRFFSSEMRGRMAADARPAAVASLVASLPADFPRWDPLAQAQYLEVVTLLNPYILASQGDRMLMANSVEGRFPFLDKEVMAFANAMPARFKLRGLDEKHVLKRAAAEVLPREILERPKQPYRAPDAACFTGPDAPEWVRELTTEAALKTVGVFDATAVTALLEKARRVAAKGGDAGFSNADNMAVVGVLSTQLLHRRLIEETHGGSDDGVAFRTEVDRVG
jgi:asparagine synthase (glutamine-hydrolysing)